MRFEADITWTRSPSTASLAMGMKSVSMMPAEARSFRKSKKPEQIFEASIKSLMGFPWDAATLVALGKACRELGYDESALVSFQFAVEADLKLLLRAGESIGQVAELEIVVAVNEVGVKGHIRAVNEDG